MNAKFVKATKTRENPKKDNASWTIIHLLIPELVKSSANETEGAVVEIMSLNDKALFELVKDCIFGDVIEVEPVMSWRNGRLQPDWKILSV